MDKRITVALAFIFGALLLATFAYLPLATQLDQIANSGTNNSAVRFGPSEDLPSTGFSCPEPDGTYGLSQDDNVIRLIQNSKDSVVYYYGSSAVPSKGNLGSFGTAVNKNGNVMFYSYVGTLKKTSMSSFEMKKEQVNQVFAWTNLSVENQIRSMDLPNGNEPVSQETIQSINEHLGKYGLTFSSLGLHVYLGSCQ